MPGFRRETGTNARRRASDLPLPPLPPEADTALSLRLRERELALDALTKANSELQTKLASSEDTVKNLKARVNRRDAEIKKLKDQLREAGRTTVLPRANGLDDEVDGGLQRQQSTSSQQHTFDNHRRFSSHEREKDTLISQMKVEMMRIREIANKTARKAALRLEELQTQLAERTQQFMLCNVERAALQTRCLAFERELNRSRSQAEQMQQQQQEQQPSTESAVARSAGINADEFKGLQIAVNELVKRYSVPDVTGDSVILIVQDINGQIEKIAATADTLCERRSSGSNSIPESARSYMLGILGEDLYQKTTKPTTGTPRDVTWSRLAIKTLLSHRVFRYQEAWPLSSIGQAQQSSQELRLAYEQIQRREPQQISALWRAVTNKHMRVSSPGYHLLQTEISERTKEDITMALSLSGVKPSLNSLRNTVHTGLLQRIGKLWETVDGLTQMTKEHALSADFQLLLAPADMNFDMRRMKSVLAAPGRAGPTESSLVLCTSELGICLASSTVTRRTMEGEQNEPMGVILLKVGIVCKED